MKKEILANGSSFSTFSSVPLVADDVNAYEIVYVANEDLSGTSFEITAIRADGQKIVDSGEVFEKTARYTLKNSMHAVVGDLKIRLAILDASGSCLTTKEILFEVIEGNGPADITADTNYPILTSIIVDVRKYIENSEKTLSDLKKEIDEIHNYADERALSAESSANEYAYKRAEIAENNAKAYADQTAYSALEQAMSYVDNKDAENLKEAKAYTDERVSLLKGAEGSGEKIIVSKLVNTLDPIPIGTGVSAYDEVPVNRIVLGGKSSKYEGGKYIEFIDSQTGIKHTEKIYLISQRADGNTNVEFLTENIDFRTLPKAYMWIDRIKSLKLFNSSVSWVSTEEIHRKVLEQAKSYADYKSSEVLEKAKTDTDEKTSKTLEDAKVYTDNEVEIAKAYADEKIGGIFKGYASGEVITIDDISPVSKDIIVNLSSKNLLEYPYYHTTQTSYGITFTDNGDGSITANGTATALTNFALVDRNTFALPEGTYSFSLTPQVSDSYYLVTGKTTTIGTKSGNRVLTFEGGVIGDFVIQIKKGVTLENVTFYPRIEKGSTITEYTPYIKDNTVGIYVYGENEENKIHYSAQSLLEKDYKIEGIYPYTTIAVDTSGANMDVEYSRDLNKAFANLEQAIISLGGNI